MEISLVLKHLFLRFLVHLLNLVLKETKMFHFSYSFMELTAILKIKDFFLLKTFSISEVSLKIFNIVVEEFMS